MPATITLARSSGLGPGCARPLQVLIDGKKAGSIKAGETTQYPVSAGAHRVQVKQDLSPSDEVTVRVDEGAVQALECGCYVEGWRFFFFILWVWRVLIPGKLFYLRRKPAR